MAQTASAGAAVKTQFYQLKEVALLFGVSKGTIHRAIDAGKIPTYRLLKYPLIPKSWVDEQVAQANSAAAGGVK